MIENQIPSVMRKFGRRRVRRSGSAIVQRLIDIDIIVTVDAFELELIQIRGIIQHTHQRSEKLTFVLDGDIE